MRKIGFVASILLSGMITLVQDVFAQQLDWQNTKRVSQVVELASCGPWETIKQDQGVILRSRWLAFGDTLKTREISLRFIVSAAMQDVLDNLMKPDRFHDWNDGVRSVKMYKRSDSSWITHIVYDIPKPLSQQDLVVMHEMKTEERRILIHMYAIPDYVPLLKNVNRQRQYFGQWEIISLNNTRTEVRFSAISFSKTNIPRFVRDPIIQNKMMRSFIMLKKQASHPSEVASL